MSSNNVSAKLKSVTGWFFDVYPAGQGEGAIWIIAKSGERIRFVDRFQPKVFVSGKQDDLERLSSTFYRNVHVSCWGLAISLCIQLTFRRVRC